MAFACLVAGLAPLFLTGCKDGVTDLDLGLKGPADLSGAEVWESDSITGYNILPEQGNLASDEGRMVLSWRSDPRTGTLESTGNFELRLPDVKAPAPDLKVRDSIRPMLTITFPYSITEKEVTQMDAVFSLYELADGYDPNRVYFTHERLPLKTYGTDSLVAQVRLNRIDTLATSSFSTKTLTFGLQEGSPITQAVLEYVKTHGWDANDLAFTSLLKGLAIRMETFEAGTSTRTPSVVSLSVGTSSTASLRYWHTVQTPPRGVFRHDTLVKDSVVMQLNALCRHHTSVRVDRAGSRFQAEMQPGDSGRLTDPINRHVYMQGGRPIWAHVDLPGLNGFLARERNIIILRAELLLPNIDGPTPKPNNTILAYRGKPDAIQLTRNNLNTTGIPNEDLQNTAINYFFDSTAQQYSVNITPFVLGVATAKEANQGVTLSVAAANFSYRTFTFNTLPNDPKRARLKIYFVRPNTGG